MKPILFSTPMVQAILNGRKTMTRRVMKPQPAEEKCYGICTGTTGSNKNIGKVGFGNGGNKIEFIPVKYSVGDILWVRERYREFCGMTYCWQGGAYIPAYDFCGIQYFTDSAMRRTDEGCFGEMFLPSEDVKTDIEYSKWRPSIFMPCEAARIFLRVTDVRAERAQDITEEDAEREGVTARHDTACSGTSARIAFAELWDGINDKRGYGWNVNPWVWVISFERVNISEDTL